ncbi:MAG: PIN domain-containing protein [Lachnospiraceae bacterium]|nr:PIN domain-containing protein [Lachnospiraceae bacterium]
MSVKRERRCETKKLKIYIDTSVVSHLDASDRPEWMADTLKLWEDMANGKYEIFTSNVAIGEIYKCSEPKRSFMLDKLKEIELSVVNAETKVEDLSQEFIKLGILKEKSLDDCMHIATALLLKCDVIVSWNFKHIVNDKTIEGVKTISKTKGFDGIKIYCPSILIGGDDDE